MNLIRHFNYLKRNQRYFNSNNNKEYCYNLLKKHDYENYLLGLLLPSSSSSLSSHSKKDLRSNFFIIHSFNIEMALIKLTTNNNKKAAQLRYKWWLEFINNVYNHIDEHHSNNNSNNISKELNFDQLKSNYQHPVAEELISIIYSNNLSKRWFEYIIESRLQDIISPNFETLSNLEDFVEKSHSSLNYLTLEILNSDNNDNNDNKYPEEIDHMASHIGVAYGLVSILRGTATDISQGQLRVPSESLINKGLPLTFHRNLLNSATSSQKLSVEDEKKFKDIIFDIASQAHGHLDRARTLQTNIPSSYLSKSIYALLPAVFASHYLEELRKVDFNPLDPVLLNPSNQFWIQLELYKRKFTKKI